MKYLFIIILVVLISCEKAVDVELPYEKKIVILGKISTDELNTKLQISKTLPPLQPTNYDYSEDARIFDEEISFTKNGEDVNINRYEDTFEYYVYDYFESGDNIRIEVNHDGISAFCETRIPDEFEIDSVYYTVETSRNVFFSEFEHEISVYCIVDAEPGYCYHGGYGYIWQGLFLDRYYSDDLFLPNDFSDKLHIKAATLYEYSTDEDYTPDQIFDDYVFFVDKLDQPYYNYIKTKERADNDFELFGFSGMNTVGNIHGDGIGVFVGSYLDTIKIKY